MADFNYDKDHPKVQGLKKFINKNREEKSKKTLNKMFTKIGLIDESKNRPMTDEEAKKLADKIETRTSKRVSKTEGSFKGGGRVCKLAKRGKGRAYGKNSYGWSKRMVQTRLGRYRFQEKRWGF